MTFKACWGSKVLSFAQTLTTPPCCSKNMLFFLSSRREWLNGVLAGGRTVPLCFHCLSVSVLPRRLIHMVLSAVHQHLCTHFISTDWWSLSMLLLPTSYIYFITLIDEEKSLIPTFPLKLNLQLVSSLLQARWRYFEPCIQPAGEASWLDSPHGMSFRLQITSLPFNPEALFSF